MKKQLLTKTTVCLLLLATIYSSCKKDPTADPRPNPPQQDKTLAVALNNDYLPASKLDSAFAIWETGSSKQMVRLTEAGEKLTASLGQFTQEGTGTLTIQLFSQTKINEVPLQWEMQLPYTLKRTVPLEVAAPTSLNDRLWYPRAIYRSEIHAAHFTAIVALRIDDSYFALQGIAPGISKRIEVARSFHTSDMTTLVASRGWVGQAANLDAAGNLIDRDHFRNLAEQIDNRAWHKQRVRVSFYAQTNPNQIFGAEFIHDRL